MIEDGVYGAKTKAAVREFQRCNGLVVDGVMGERTRATLAKALETLNFNRV